MNQGPNRGQVLEGVSEETLFGSERGEEREVRCVQCLRRERTRSVQEMEETPRGWGRVSERER